MASENWKDYIDWLYPYNKRNILTDPKYIKDRNEIFAKHGNGWWWGDGWWNGKEITIAEKTRRRRAKGKEQNENEI